MMQRISAFLLVLLVMTLAACQPIAIDRKQSTVTAESLISEAETAGDLQAAADDYLAKAAASEGALQSAYYFRAANMLYKLAEYPKALDALKQIAAQQLNPAEQIDAALLRADIAIIQEDPAAALTALDSFDMDTASDQQKTQALSLRIDAYLLSDNMLDKALAHIELDPLLSGADQTINRQELWQALMALDAQQLDLFNPGQPPAEDSGWFALAYAMKAYENNPEAMAVALEDWQRSFPNHPADIASLSSTIKPALSLSGDIDNIAVLLPESGPIAGVAEAVKQGIIAAHFLSGSDRQLKFYDVQNNAAAAYQRAVEAGASIVIGPLDKPSVEQLVRIDSLPIPVIALNRVTDQHQHHNFFQFGLAPEDEARTAAKFAAEQGYRRALVIGPRSDWGERVTEAFETAWRDEGGVTVRSTSYRESATDFSEVIMQLFGLNASTQRAKALQSTLGRTLSYEPRRRQDVDFIFMVAKPLKARQLVPQFRFHRSGNLPVISTSHAYDGEANARYDIDLNGTIISDIPWMIEASDDPAYQGLLDQVRGDKGTYLRLAAMGVDAYRLIDHLVEMSRSSDIRYEGVTGSLQINQNGHIQRLMPQGIFKDGLISPLSTDR
ncbi:MAG TPA: penicillin-binding protein activator [Methylophaga sp.]|nr:penicillin-binding protein activator [Methylophaga sp.]